MNPPRSQFSSAPPFGLPRDLPVDSRGWVWIAILLSFAVCITLSFEHYRQRELIRDTQLHLESIGRARIDLARGFLAFDPFDTAPDPVSPAEAFKTVDAGIALIRHSHAANPALTGDLLSDADAFRRQLTLWQQAPPASRPALLPALRRTFAELDHHALQIDLAARDDLRDLADRLDRRFALSLAFAALLLTGICVGTIRAGRAQSRALRALRESEERLHLVGDNLPDSYVYQYVRDPAGDRFTYASAGVARVHGISVEQALRDTPALLTQICPEFLAPFAAAVDRSAHDLTDFEFELNFVRADGAPRRLHLHSHPTRHADGQVRWEGIATDITEAEKNREILSRHQTWLQAMSSVAHIGGWDFDPLTGEGGWTDEVARIYDMDPAEPTNREIGLNAYHGLWRKKIEAAIAEAVNHGTPYDLELQIVTHKGNSKWVRTQGIPVLRDGRVIRMRGTLQDITDRKRDELALREQKDRLALIAATAPGVLHSIRLSPDGRLSYPYASPRIREIYGVHPEALLEDASIIRLLQHPDDVPRIIASVEESRRTLAPWSEQFRVNHPEKGEIWVEGHSVPVEEPDGSVTWHGVLTDITARRLTENTIRDGETRFRLLFEQAADGIIIFSADRRYEEVNPRAATLLGFPASAIIGRPIGIATASGDRGKLDSLVARLLASGELVSDWRIQRPDGTAVDTEVSARRLSDGRVIVILRDLTERRRADARTLLQHEVTRILAQSAPLGDTATQVIAAIGAALHFEFGAFWTIDRTTQRLRCLVLWEKPSLAFGEFTALTRRVSLAKGEGVPGSVWSGRAPRWWQDVSIEKACSRHLAAREAGLRDVMACPAPAHGEVFGVFEFYSTLTRAPDPATIELIGLLGAQVGQFIERQLLEDQFRQAQKMEAIGTLAGGIAHDFNNILSAILSYTTLARMAAEDTSAIGPHLDEVDRAAARATELVRQILAFSRRQQQQRSLVQLRHVIAESVRLLRASIPSTIDFDIDLATDLPAVLADATQIQQVVMNLGTNAWHAMRDRHGRLGIRAEAVTLTSALASAPLAPGRYVHLTVSDTGHGMDAATRARIFEPFFTTKEVGDGTGLGLAVVHGIVQSHGGSISVDSEPGTGTTFHLHFPAADGSATPFPPARSARPRGHGENILVIDDEEPIARSTRLVLERHGYRVELSLASPAALARLESAPDDFALVLTDQNLPDLTGLALASRVRALRPALPIVLTTGYTPDLTDEKIRAAGIARVLPKPATTDQLLATLAELLHPVPDA